MEASFFRLVVAVPPDTVSTIHFKPVSSSRRAHVHFQFDLAVDKRDTFFVITLVIGALYVQVPEQVHCAKTFLIVTSISLLKRAVCPVDPRGHRVPPAIDTHVIYCNSSQPLRAIVFLSAASRSRQLVYDCCETNKCVSGVSRSETRYPNYPCTVTGGSVLKRKPRFP